MNGPLGLNMVLIKSYLKENINYQFNVFRVDVAIFCIKTWTMPELVGALKKGLQYSNYCQSHKRDF